MAPCAAIGPISRRQLLPYLFGSLTTGCLVLLLLVTPGPVRQRAPGPVQPPPVDTPLHQRLRAPDAALLKLTLADVMTTLRGSTDLELVRQQTLARPDGCPARAVVPWAGGRTGNLLYEYLAAWALARRNDATLLIPDQMVEEFEGVFPALTAQRGDLDLLMIDCAAAWRQRALKELETIQDVQLPLPPDGWVELLGFPDKITEPAYQLMHQHAAELRRELRFSEGIVQVVQDYLWRVRRALAPRGDDVTFVGVHVRRADYYHAVFNLEGVWMTEPDERYFARGVRHYHSRYSNVVFLVVSDDMPWCRQHLSALDATVLFPGDEGNPALLDLALLAHCNHTLITYGSFALSGALLNGGEIVVASDVGVKFTMLERQKEFWKAGWTEISVK